MREVSGAGKGTWGLCRTCPGMHVGGTEGRKKEIKMILERNKCGKWKVKGIKGAGCVSAGCW